MNDWYKEPTTTVTCILSKFSEKKLYFLIDLSQRVLEGKTQNFEAILLSDDRTDSKVPIFFADF